jgi:hypothetical protein
MTTAVLALPLDSLLQAATSRMVEHLPQGLRAIVLNGSLARGEGTWMQGRLVSDAEFLAVFEDRAALPGPDHIDKLSCAIEAELGIHAVISPVPLHYLRSLEPHLFAYELRIHGRVLWGEDRILALVPPFEPDRIPLDDAFRLLSNRMIELLEALCVEGNEEIASYRALKLVLDMGTSYLLFEDTYRPSYRARAARLQVLARAKKDGCPFLPVLARRVAHATRVKLGETGSGFDLTPEIVDEVRELWRWELEQLTRLHGAASDRDLLRQWMRSQPWAARMRGWASLFRRCGFRPLAHFRFGASPRSLVYAATAELFFALPGASRRWNSIRHNLPLAVAVQSGSAWRALGLAIAENYHRYLEFTRA